MLPRLETLGSCPICCDRESRPAFCGRDRLFGIEGEFGYRRCNSCGSYFQDPRVVKEDLPLCYPACYSPHHTAATSQESAASAPLRRRFSGLRDRLRRAVVGAVRHESRARRALDAGRWVALFRRARERSFRDAVIDELLPRTPQEERALDVGCGNGGLLAALSSVGWRAEGVEPSAEAAEAARLSSGCRVRVGDILDVELPQDAYGLVVLHHVVEHLPEPNAVLTRLRASLRPGGRLVLVWPNPHSLGARRLGSSWAGWDVPRHLSVAPRSAIAAACSSVGLRPLAFRTTARHAAAFCAMSRAMHRSVPVDIENPPVAILDRLFGAIETLLVGLGLPFGEEAILTAERPAVP